MPLEASAEPVQISNESTGAKILREADLLGSVGSGFVAEAKRAVENPGETSLKVAGAAALGVGLAVVTHKPGMIGLAAKSVGLAGGVAFGLEVVKHGADVTAAANSSWQSEAQHWQNKSVVSNSAGAFSLIF
jgi:hypothetical protein